MRDALVRAALAEGGALGASILKAAKRIKPRPSGGWNVIRKGERRGRRSR